MAKWFRRLAAWSAVAFPVATLLVALALRVLGERWWVTNAALYLPRAAFALPLLVIVPALLALRMFKLLWTQLLALLVVLFPLMGLVVGPPGRRSDDGPHLRLLSMNVNSGYSGYDKVSAAVAEISPDIALLQEATVDAEELEALLSSKYKFVHRSTQFVLGSRFPILEQTNPDETPYFGQARSPRFMRYVIETPLGRVSFFSVHPISPRQGLSEMRGLRRKLISGEVVDPGPELQRSAELRRQQLEATLHLAAFDSYPVVIAGDLNLPGLSTMLSQFDRYQDGFRSAGSGFLGYTYPTRLPWMRLDRIFASNELKLSDFRVGCRGVSDHLCVYAELSRP